MAEADELRNAAKNEKDPVIVNEMLKDALGKEAVKELLPMQPGDVPDTFANVQALGKWHQCYVRYLR